MTVSNAERPRGQSIQDFVGACDFYLAHAQDTPGADTWLIALLCDAARLTRSIPTHAPPRRAWRPHSGLSPQEAACRWTIADAYAWWAWRMGTRPLHALGYARALGLDL
jgi:hypothetical protein